MAAGVRQVEIAAVLGVSASTVSQYESGRRVPDAEHALAYDRAVAAAEGKSAA